MRYTNRRILYFSLHKDVCICFARICAIGRWRRSVYTEWRYGLAQVTRCCSLSNTSMRASGDVA